MIAVADACYANDFGCSIAQLGLTEMIEESRGWEQLWDNIWMLGWWSAGFIPDRGMLRADLVLFSFSYFPLAVGTQERPTWSPIAA